MTHAEASLVAPGGELVQLASESSQRIDSTTGAGPLSHEPSTPKLPERDRPLRGWQTPPQDPTPPLWGPPEPDCDPNGGRFQPQSP